MGEHKKKSRKGDSRLAFVHNLLKKHWCWYTIILALPSAWFTVILPYAGRFLGLQTPEGDLTSLGLKLTVSVVLFVFLISFLNNLYLKKTEKGELEKLKGNAEYLATIMDSVDRICDEKCTRLENKIVEAKTTNAERAEIISNPVSQLQRIVNGITECLVKLLSNVETEFAFKDFFVTIAYNFPQENDEWKWLDGTTEKDMTLENLLGSKVKSTFNHLLETGQPYYFNNRKEDAKKEGKYIYNPQDQLSEEMGETLGSIFCYRYRIIKGSKTYVDVMISISTQKKCFAKDEKEACANVRNNMVSLIRDSFGKRIGIELSLLYLEYLKKQDSSNK